MAYRPRKTSTRTSKNDFKAGDYLPLWNQKHTHTAHLMAQMVFSRMGVTDLHSYFRVLAIPICLCAGMGCAFGVSQWGIKGSVAGAVAGLAGPAALVYSTIVACYAAVLVAAFVAVWAFLITLVYLVLLY